MGFRVQGLGSHPSPRPSPKAFLTSHPVQAMSCVFVCSLFQVHDGIAWSGLAWPGIDYSIQFSMVWYGIV